jgi:glycosyltransferase involved in cell wall biosynthesis
MKLSVLTAVYPTREEPARGSPIWATLAEFCGRVDFTVNCSLALPPEWIRRRVRPRSYLRYPTGVDVARNPALPAKTLEYLYLPGVTRVFNGRLLAQAFRKRVREERPDVILAYRIYPDGFAAVSAGRALGIPAVIGSRGSDLKLMPEGGLIRRDTVWALRNAAGVLCVSEDLARIARRWAPEHRVHYVRNGVDERVFFPVERDVERKRLGIALDRKLVVFTGNLIPVKGIPILLRALSLLRNGGLTLHAALIGEGGMRQELEGLAAELGVAGQVAFLGAKSAPEIAQWLNAADVFCLPSQSEGMPNVLLEALSCGRNVVATDVGGAGEIVGESSGILTPSGDADALAAGLRRSLDVPWDRSDIAESSRFSWAQVAEKTLAICAGANLSGRAITATGNIG